MAFRIEVAPLEDGETFTPMMLGIEERMVDVLPLYDAWYGAFRKIEQKRFNSEGPGWVSLAPSTVAQRESLGIGGEHPILNRSGADDRGRRGGQLRRSFTTLGAKGAVFEILPDGVFMGSDDFLAKIHHEGTDTAGRGRHTRIPARPLVDEDSEVDAELYANVAGDYFWGFSITGSVSTEAESADLFAVDSFGL